MEVVDFTEYTTDEIIEYFKKGKGSKTCGRLKETQFDLIDKRLSQSQFSPSKKLALPLTIATLIFTSSCNTSKRIPNYSLGCDNMKIEVLENELNKDKTEYNIVKGKIIDEDGEILIGAIISVGNSEHEMITDENGEFEYKYSNSKLDKIKISLLGYEECELDLSVIQNKNVEITLPAIWLGEVEIIPKYKMFWKK